MWYLIFLLKRLFLYVRIKIYDILISDINFTDIKNYKNNPIYLKYIFNWIYKEWYLPKYWMNKSEWYERFEKRYLEDRQDTLFTKILTYKDIPIWMVSISYWTPIKKYENALLLNSLYIDKWFRRKWLARFTLKHIIFLLKEDFNAKHFLLEDSSNIKNFYSSQWFKLIGKDNYTNRDVYIYYLK